ncbi:MAG: polysaccharide deacetylase family protein [Chthoniobacteraceae bacterium]
MSPTRALVVSLHDVSPSTRPASARILAELAAIGVSRTSLLVIPDHHHRGPLLADAAFRRWLAEKEQEGHEIVTHGYYHQRARRTGETTLQKITTRFYTADEGEFYDLDRATARELVARGNTDLQRAGLHPHGFIAPAWLLGVEAAAALRELGVEYTTTLGAVRDLKNERAWESQSLVWSVRSGWRRMASRAWNAVLFPRLRANPLLRISIHPVDLDHRAIWRQIRTLLARALADREPMTYHAWITGQRAAPASHLQSQAS